MHDQAEVGAPGGQQQATAQLGSATSEQQCSLKQGAGPASHARGKGTQQGARSFTLTRAVFSSDGQQESLDISATVVPPVSSVPRDDNLRRQGHPFQRGVPNKLVR